MNKKTTKKINKATDFQVYLKEQLKDKEFKRYYEECGKQLEVAYQIFQLRKKFRLSQKELARRVGTTQSNVARMEQGRQNFTIGTLDKIAKVFGRELKVSIN